ncbi:hypothetical protein Patl1_13139 [Pistacia atlantica]|uniref:Uncharacterized protein n=1 Tax=Pistacia atlantica TaxID=434234 RepID=A0ACC1AUV9_9ROSI|nr:hypothetical protein Patl1_13139 [Pistacia atlantica]
MSSTILATYGCRLAAMPTPSLIRLTASLAAMASLMDLILKPGSSSTSRASDEFLVNLLPAAMAMAASSPVKALSSDDLPNLRSRF